VVAARSREVSGAFAFLGARPATEDPATATMLHSNRVVFDEDAMAVGVATHVAVTLRYPASDASRMT